MGQCGLRLNNRISRRSGIEKIGNSTSETKLCRNIARITQRQQKRVIIQPTRKINAAGYSFECLEKADLKTICYLLVSSSGAYDAVVSTEVSADVTEILFRNGIVKTRTCVTSVPMISATGFSRRGAQQLQKENARKWLHEIRHFSGTTVTAYVCRAWPEIAENKPSGGIGAVEFHAKSSKISVALRLRCQARRHTAMSIFCSPAWKSLA